MDNIKDIVSTLGHVEDNIKTVYLCGLYFLFENSLGAIETNEVCRELTGLLSKLKFVCVYVEHIDDGKSKGGNKHGNAKKDNSYFADADDESIDRLWPKAG